MLTSTINKYSPVPLIKSPQIWWMVLKERETLATRTSIEENGTAVEMTS